MKNNCSKDVQKAVREGSQSIPLQTTINSQRQQKRKKGPKDLQDRKQTINMMALGSPFLSMIILNVNKLSSPEIRVAELILKKRKQEPTICYLQEAHSSFKKHI